MADQRLTATEAAAESGLSYGEYLRQNGPRFQSVKFDHPEMKALRRESERALNAD